ncbi:MAG: hypothetical protein FD126_125 [Elusimicrobia bacterium]|nr:MAG: hypothetical protein FD126_125 [Elusimicrobiota bacterium]
MVVLLSISGVFVRATDSGQPDPFEETEDDLIEEAVRQAERRELVIPAPSDFKPTANRRKLRLTLRARDKTIRVGETIWYKLELQNLGLETVHFWETPSFLKNGSSYDMGRWDFFVSTPGGKRRMMVVGSFFDQLAIRDTRTDAIPIPGSAVMTDEEIARYIRREGAQKRHDRDLIVDLAPGETLVSRPWRWVNAQERLERGKRGEVDLVPRPTGDFRELWTSYKFESPGRFEIRAVYDDSSAPMPSESFIKGMERQGYSRESVIANHRERIKEDLGRVESNSITVLVTK